MQTSFPRGGVIQQKTTKKFENINEVQGLFSISEKGKVKRKKSTSNNKERNGTWTAKKSKNDTNADIDNALPFGMDRKPKYAFRFNSKKNSIGTVALGIVSSIQKNEATITLPGSVIGHLSLENISDQHSSNADDIDQNIKTYLHPGKLVKCCYIGTDDNKRVLVSMAASNVNRKTVVKKASNGATLYGSVQSVEDHGYVVSFGFDDIATGFMKFADAIPEMKVGESAEFLIESIRQASKVSRKTFTVTCDPTKLANASEASCVSLDTLQVGMRVNAVIKDWLSDGMWVGFMGMFNGTVDWFHMMDWKIDRSMEIDRSSKGQREARILFIDFESKQIALTCAERVLNRSPEIEKLDATFYGAKTFDVFTDCVIRRIDPHAGILVEVPVEPVDGIPKSYVAYARKNNIANHESDIVEIDKKYKVGQFVSCKVLGHCAIDGVWNVSLSKDIIEASVLKLQDVVPGQNVTCKVFKIEEFGVLVALSDNIRGLIPNLHLGDVMISDPRRRFKIGQSINCRVLQVGLNEANKPRIILTHKKSLLNSDLPVISSYDQLTEPTVAHGFVTLSKKDKGVIVTFYNNVHGLIRLAELRDLGIEDPSTVYQVGQVVKVKSVSCTPDKEQLLLTFRTAASGADDAKLAQEFLKQFPAGTIVKNAVVKAIRGETISVQIHAKKKEYQGIIATSDLYDLAEGPVSLAVGDTVDAAFVLGYYKDSVRLSTRPLFLQFPKQVPLNYTDVAEFSVIHGYAKSISETGVVVAFANDVVGFVPKSNVADEWVDTPSKFIKAKQSLICHVVSVNAETKRMTLSLKQSAVTLEAAVKSCYLKELLTFHGHDKMTHIGTIVNGTIFQVKQGGVSIHMDDIADSAHCNKELQGSLKDPEENQKVSCQILDWDESRKCYDVCIVDSGKKTTSKTKKRKATSGSFDAQVKLIKSEYIVVTLPESDNKLGFAPLRCFNGRIVDLPKNIAVGSVIPVQSLDQEVNNVFLVDLVKPTMRTRARSSSNLDTTQEAPVTLKPGAHVRGRVRDMGSHWMGITMVNVKSPEGMPERCMGQVHVTMVSDDYTPDTNAYAGYNIGDVVEGVIVSMDEKVDPNGKSFCSVWISLRASDMGKRGKLKQMTLDDVKTGTKYQAFITKYTKEGCIVTLSPTVDGFVYCSRISTEAEVLNAIFNDSQDPPTNLQPGAPVTVQLIRKDASGKYVEFSII